MYGERSGALGSDGLDGPVVVAQGLSYLVTCGIFPDQQLNLCPLHWQVNL